MKKLYRKGSVHPSPQIKSQDHLSLLPAAILSLTTLLSPEDREVLAYLMSSAYANNPLNKNPSFRVSSGKKKNKKPNSRGNNDHPPQFHCDCFSCYMSYWVRWDSSPNRQLIHEIIDEFEDCLEKNKKVTITNGKKDRRKRRSKSVDGGGEGAVTNSGELTRSAESSPGSDAAEECPGDGKAEEEKGSVRRFVSFIGERIFGVWG